MVSAKTERLNIRCTEEEETLFRKAADEEKITLSEFMLRSAKEEASRVLADKRWYELDEERYDLFLEVLEKPMSTEKLSALFNRPNIFESNFKLNG